MSIYLFSLTVSLFHLIINTVDIILNYDFFSIAHHYTGLSASRDWFIVQQFIEKKRSIGFIYEHEEWELKHFDRLCCEKGVSELALSRALVMEWGQLRENEFKSTSSSRFSVIRQFGLYLLSLDLEAYLPSNYSYSSKGKTHVAFLSMIFPPNYLSLVFWP